MQRRLVFRAPSLVPPAATRARAQALALSAAEAPRSLFQDAATVDRLRNSGIGECAVAPACRSALSGHSTIRAQSAPPRLRIARPSAARSLPADLGSISPRARRGPGA